MKKLVATQPRVAELMDYEDRPVAAYEVKIRVKFGAPKHGTEVVDFRGVSPFIDEEFSAEWGMFVPSGGCAARYCVRRIPARQHGGGHRLRKGLRGDGLRAGR